MGEQLQAFKKASATIGADIDMVQAAGGNTSIKLDAGVMLVKASGKWLRDALSEDIFVGVRWRQVKANIDNGLDDCLLNSAADQASRLRPSIETSLHSLMPHKIVIHTHSVSTIAQAIYHDSAARLAPLLDGLRWSLVPYSKPGVPLTRLVAQALQKNPCDVLVIQNHGLVVGGDSVEEAMALLRQVEAAVELEVKPSAAKGSSQERDGWLMSRSALAVSLAESERASAVATGGSLYPDHVVFLGSGMAFASDAEQARLLLTRPGEGAGPLAPKAAIVAGRGVLHAADLSAAGVEMLKCVAAVALRAPMREGIRYLSRDEELELVNWDAEKYRQSN